MNWKRLFPFMLLGALLGGSNASAESTEAEFERVGAREAGPELERIELESEAGQALLAGARAVDFEAMQEHWIPQLRSHCGAASAVIVKNSMIDDAPFTQDNLFTEDTSHIITQDVVYRIGFTLDELKTMIAARSDLETEHFHAGTGEELHDVEAFREALRVAMDDPNTRLIANFSRQFWLGTGTLGGHFSPVAAWNEEENKVLILEVNQSWPMVWLDVDEFWESMYTIDRISGMTRGWILVNAPE